MGILDPKPLTQAAAAATYATKWKPNTAYLAGEAVTSPSGDLVTAKVNFTSGASYSAANWNLVQGRIVGSNGKKYRIIAAALRNNGAPNYWEVISDAAHVPVGVASVTSNGSTITVNYDFNASTIGTFVAVTDETMGRLNLFAGASVGLSSATITLSQPSDIITDLVYYDGTNWLSQNTQYTVESYTAGVLTLNHRNIYSTSGNVQVSSRGGARRAVLANASPPVSATQVKVEFYDNAGTLVTTPDTNMKALVTRTSRPGARNPQTVVDTTIEPLHNLWIYGCHEIA